VSETLQYHQIVSRGPFPSVSPFHLCSCSSSLKHSISTSYQLARDPCLLLLLLSLSKDIYMLRFRYCMERTSLPFLPPALLTRIQTQPRKESLLVFLVVLQRVLVTHFLSSQIVKILVWKMGILFTINFHRVLYQSRPWRLCSVCCFHTMLHADKSENKHC